MEIALECISKQVSNENLCLSKVELVLERETTKLQMILLYLAKKKKKKGTSVSCNFWKLRKMHHNLT